jgi:hypothetical protein
METVMQDQDTGLSNLKKAASSSITLQRTSQLTKGVEFDGNMYDITAPSISSLSAIVSAMQLQTETMPKAIAWRTTTNTIIQHTLASLTQLLSAMVIKNQQVFEDSWVLKDEVLQAKTFQEMMQILSKHQTIN